MPVKCVEALWVRCGGHIGGTADDMASPHVCLYQEAVDLKGGYVLVTLPRIVTPYCDSVDGTRDRVTYQTLVTR